MQEQLLKDEDVARITRMSVASVRRWRLEHRGPRYIKIGTSVRYRLGDVQKWIRSQPTGGKVKPKLARCATVSSKRA